MLTRPRHAPLLELQAEPDTRQLPDVIGAGVAPATAEQLDRAAQQAPRMRRQAAAEVIGPAAAALAQLGEEERCEAFRIGDRLARQREKVEQFEQTKHGARDQAALDAAWQHIGGDRRLIALELGRFGLIRRGQVWDCRNQRWTGFEWQGFQRLDFADSYPADYPLAQDLRNQGFALIPAKVFRASKVGLGIQLTTVDHLLHDLGRRGVGVLRIGGFTKAVNAPALARQRQDKQALEAKAKGWLRPWMAYAALLAVLAACIWSTT